MVRDTFVLATLAVGLYAAVVTIYEGLECILDLSEWIFVFKMSIKIHGYVRTRVPS